MRPLSGIHTHATPNGNLLRSALCAQPTENQLALPNNSLTNRPLCRPGHVVPLKIFHVSASVADEVMMQQSLRIESRCAALYGNLAHQPCLYQISQIVIRRSPRRPRIHAIHGFEDLDSRGMPVLFHQERHHGVALRSAPQPAAFQRKFDRLGVHENLD
jgi:hypothetical protein